MKGGQGKFFPGPRKNQIQKRTEVMGKGGKGQSNRFQPPRLISKGKGDRLQAAGSGGKLGENAPEEELVRTGVGEG